MQYYMESRLTYLHWSNIRSEPTKLLTAFMSFLPVIIIPAFHLGTSYYLWSANKPLVDKQKCSCTCFDTIFRGGYEWPPSSYKHMYFNSTLTMFKIWVAVTIGVIVCYEAFKKVVTMFRMNHLRHSMFVVFLSSLYPHYYGWWNLIQYLNEEFFGQWYHQMFFSATELVSSFVILHLCDKRNSMKPWKLLLIIDLNLIHIIVSAIDQFIANVIQSKGQYFEIVRDFGLMFPDLLHVFVAFFELSVLADRKSKSLLKLFHLEELFMFFLSVMFLSILGKIL